MYDDTGALAGHKVDTCNRAIRRGDLPPQFAEMYDPHVPLDAAAMRRRLGSSGNAMSCLRWEYVGPSLSNTQADAEHLFALVTGRHSS